MFSICTCSRAPAAAAATGAFTGSLGRNTSEERDTRARPGAAADRGGCWEHAIDSETGGVTVEQKETKIRRVSSSGTLRPSLEAPGDPGEGQREQRRAVRPAHYVGSEAQQPGGAFVLRGLPLSCQASLYL